KSCPERLERVVQGISSVSAGRLGGGTAGSDFSACSARSNLPRVGSAGLGWTVYPSGGLHDPVTNRRNRQRPLLLRRRARLRDIDPPGGQRTVAALLQLGGQL